MNITKINNMTSRLAISKDILLLNGYKEHDLFIGMHRTMWLFCAFCNKYGYHNLMARNYYDYKYVCNKCNCCVEYVG